MCMRTSRLQKGVIPTRFQKGHRSGCRSGSGGHHPPRAVPRLGHGCPAPVGVPTAHSCSTCFPEQLLPPCGWPQPALLRGGGACPVAAGILMEDRSGDRPLGTRPLRWMSARPRGQRGATRTSRAVSRNGEWRATQLLPEEPGIFLRPFAELYRRPRGGAPVSGASGVHLYQGVSQALPAAHGVTSCGSHVYSPWNIRN